MLFLISCRDKFRFNSQKSANQSPFCKEIIIAHQNPLELCGENACRKKYLRAQEVR